MTRAQATLAGPIGISVVLLVFTAAAVLIGVISYTIAATAIPRPADTATVTTPTPIPQLTIG